MRTVRCRGVVMVVVCILAAALASAQLTFSRDWTGGKRASSHMALDCGQFTRLCRRFVHEMKQAVTSEMSGERHRDDLDKTLFYDDE